MSKIYLCGITNENEYQNIEELTDPIWEYVDGLIFGYDQDRSFPESHAAKNCEDACYSILDERKKEGEIICRPWTNDHDLQMNTFLREGPLKNGDWFIIRDSMERFDKTFAKQLPDILIQLQSQGIMSVFYNGKGFAFCYNDSMIFQGSPHWGLQNYKLKSYDLAEIFPEHLKKSTWRIKDGETGGRPIDNKIDHEAKYAWVYGRSNHLLLGLETSMEEYQRAEIIRRHIRDLATINNFKLNIEGLKEFMKWLKDSDLEAFSSFINSHRVWKNFYRFHILKEDFLEIEKTEKDWKFKPVTI